MFDTRQETVSDATRRYWIERSGTTLSYADTMRLLRQDAAFRTYFLTLLSDPAFAAYRWETPPVTTQTASRPFEFVLHDAPELSCAPDTQTFAAHFSADRDDDGIVVFDNLGHDATLVVPCPTGPDNDYSHLAAFVRNAPDSHQHALLRTLAQAVDQRLTRQPLWVSTAGDGVAWLHVRLDSRPKYYRYRPYRSTG